MIMLFCSPWCDALPEIDWTVYGDDIVESTLRRDYLLVKLQELVDSKTAQAAESAVRAMDEALDEDEDAIYLHFLDQAGTLSILEDVLNREKDQPSPLVAAPLLYKFAKHDIGYKRTGSGKVVACERT
jgi:hypothetical protein